MSVQLGFSEAIKLDDRTRKIQGIRISVQSTSQECFLIWEQYREAVCCFEIEIISRSVMHVTLTMRIEICFLLGRGELINSIEWGKKGESLKLISDLHTHTTSRTPLHWPNRARVRLDWPCVSSYADAICLGG